MFASILQFTDKKDQEGRDQDDVTDSNMDGLRLKNGPGLFYVGRCIIKVGWWRTGPRAHISLLFLYNGQLNRPTGIIPNGQSDSGFEPQPHQVTPGPDDINFVFMGIKNVRKLFICAW